MESKSMEKTIIEGNRVIAEFDGWRFYPRIDINDPCWSKPGQQWAGVDAPGFESHWELLMPVVEKISRIEFDRDEQELPMGGVEILIHTYYPRTFGMLNNETRRPMFRYNLSQLFEADTLIQAAWLATVDFISWYSQGVKPAK